MKRVRFLAIIIALTILFIITATVINSCTGEEVSIVGVDKTKPAIDLNRPSVTEAATFALG